MKSGELKSELEGSLEDVRNRERAVNSQEVITQNKVMKIKERVTQELFKILRDFGVDASNLESINQFLSQVGETNPDLLKLFEITFNELMGAPSEDVTHGETAGPPAGAMSAAAAPPDNAGLMGKYKNLGQSTMMPRE